MLHLFKLLRKCLVFIFILPVIFFIPGCGGGGGGDDGGGTPTPPPPTVTLNYVVGLSTLQSDRPPLISAQSSSGDVFTITELSLSGTNVPSSDLITLAVNNGNDPNGIAFTYTPMPAVLGNGTIYVYVEVLSQAMWTSGSDPTTGEFEVGTYSGTTLGPYKVVVNVNRPGGAGVNIYSGTTLMSSLNWADFKNAQHTSNNIHEVLPSLAYNALQNTYRYVSQAYTLLEVVTDTDNQSYLQSHQSGTFTGTTNFPGRQASIYVIWLDQVLNSTIGPGDGFMSTFTDVWDDVNLYIYDGHLKLQDYWVGQDATLGTYVGGNFRFGPDGGAPSDFTERKTTSNTISNDFVTISNGFFFRLNWQ